MTKPDGMNAFFAYARQRQLGYIMKHADPEWVQPDAILREYSFCNVFRELDKTTAWLAKNVRGPLDKARSPKLLMAVVLFRMFNRIETGEAFFKDDNLLGGFSAFDDFYQTGKTAPLKRAALARMGKKGPFVTGSYIIAGPSGMSKLDGMLRVVDDFRKSSAVLDLLDTDYSSAVTRMGHTKFSLQQVHEWLSQFRYFGKFHSYEITTDLRHTHLLRRAPDINSWASPGPGCRRGLNRVFGRDKDARDGAGVAAILEEMGAVMQESTRASQWSNWANTMNAKHPKAKTPTEWEMRDVEHTLCEFDKYERTRAGEGRPRGKYRGYETARR